MRVASTPAELEVFLKNAVKLNTDYPVVVSKFYVHAKEIEFDGVAQDGRILNYAISEHVENAGVHSGDATLVLPAQKLYVETIRQVKRIAGNVAKELKISGPFNMQFLGKDNLVKVIECNLRASRSFPFVSKTFQTNFIELATKVMAGLPAVPKDIKLLDLDYVGVKAPMFSFGRLQGADPTLGVEMVSTGEVACFGQDVHEAFLLAMLSGGFKMPSSRKSVLFAVGPAHDKEELVEHARSLAAGGYTVWATAGTHRYFAERGVRSRVLRRGASADCTPLEEGEKESDPFVLDHIKFGLLDLVINIPDALNAFNVKEETQGYRLRRKAVDFGVSLVTNAKLAAMLTVALLKVKRVPCLSMEDFYQLGLPSVTQTKPLAGDMYRGRKQGMMMTLQT